MGETCTSLDFVGVTVTRQRIQVQQRSHTFRVHIIDSDEVATSAMTMLTMSLTTATLFAHGLKTSRRLQLCFPHDLKTSRQFYMSFCEGWSGVSNLDGPSCRAEMALAIQLKRGVSVVAVIT